MGVMFVVTIAVQYIIFGNVLFMTRTRVQARLNMLMLIHLVIWAIVTFATMHLFAERAFILGQAIGTVAILPWQLSVFVSELGIDRKRFLAAIGIHLTILLLGAVGLLALLHFREDPGIWMIAALMAAYSLAAWIAQYFLVLDGRERSLFLDFGRSFINSKDASPAIP
jgi:hypothetical protein